MKEKLLYTKKICREFLSISFQKLFVLFFFTLFSSCGRERNGDLRFFIFLGGLSCLVIGFLHFANEMTRSNRGYVSGLAASRAGQGRCSTTAFMMILVLSFFLFLAKKC